MMSAATRSPASGVAHRERYLGAGLRQRPGGLDADATARSRHDRSRAAQVDAGDDLGGR
jgi:hypothetical protein